MATVAPGIAVNGICGPLALHAFAEDPALAGVARSYLALFTRAWPDIARRVEVTMLRAEPQARASGSFLTAAHMSVDRDGELYLADTQYGFVARGTCAGEVDRWTVSVPFHTEFGEPETGDMEDVFSLIVTAGWRALGWVPVHAGAVVKNGACAILCANSGGGKSTLTTALIRSGWGTLGDDKLLVRRENGTACLRALLQTFNLDPATSRWFDVGDLESLPRYSAWTNKRRVPLDAIGKGSAIASATPTHVFRIRRRAEIDGIRATSMPQSEILPTLLKQIVLPGDREVSSWIVGEVAACARKLHGVTLEIGDDAYARDGWLNSIEEAL